VVSVLLSTIEILLDERDDDATRSVDQSFQRRSRLDQNDLAIVMTTKFVPHKYDKYEIKCFTKMRNKDVQKPITTNVGMSRKELPAVEKKYLCTHFELQSLPGRTMGLQHPQKRFVAGVTRHKNARCTCTGEKKEMVKKGKKR